MLRGAPKMAFMSVIKKNIKEEDTYARVKWRNITYCEEMQKQKPKYNIS